MMTKFHHYFFLQASPFPLIISLAAFNLMFSFLIFLKFKMFLSFMAGLSLISFLSFSWWISYKSEFDYEGKSSMDLEEGIKMGMVLFISSEVFFFFSFFWAYFHFFLSPGMENGFFWPPQGILSFDSSNVPFLNTLILLTSGVTVTLSHSLLNTGKFLASNFFLGITVLLGLIFTGCQFLEYESSFFSISDGNFGTSFFMLTGFHGIHVIIGTIFLLSTLIFSLLSKSSMKNFLSFEMSSWYWHFVDVVWIFLFFFLYYLNG